MDWQPIDTMPSIARHVRLKRVNEERTYTGCWYDFSGSRAWWTFYINPAEWSWMPLPDPPVTKDGA
jgi:hypothetical protein